MFCKACGKKIDDDSNFCRFCGKQQTNGKERKNNNGESKEINVNISLFQRRIEKSQKPESSEISLPQYDSTYSKETFATFCGSLIIIVNIILLSTGVYADWAYYNDNFIPIFSLFNIIWRIIVIIWVVNIAKKQNRNGNNWGMIAFILPNLALLIIGILKKIIKQQEKKDSTKQSSVPFNSFPIRNPKNESPVDEEELKQKMKLYNISYE
ncbi:MAG: zinc ribbon domain-containing protein, partial [Bacteroidales bacterium]|nr:zinc ribbon domain-containing protein [Bacteroidales bacterium]